MSSPIPNFDAGVPCPKTGQPLLPAIAQDATTGRVLMLAWMNREAWDETISGNRAVYFSRSRGKLWRKGDTSGHAQVVREIRVDCDADTILLTKPEQPATKTTKAASSAASIPMAQPTSPKNASPR